MTWLRRVLGAGLVLLLTDLAAGTAYKSYKESPNLLVWDDSVGYTHRRDDSVHVAWKEGPRGYMVLRTNNLGFREDAPTAVRSGAGVRVLVFGDSHTDGVVENPQSFPHQAERMLDSSGVKAELINAGIGHTSVYQQSLHLRRLLYLNPDAVVFTLYAGNDYMEILWKHLPHLAVEADRVVEEPALERPMTDQWIDHSIILRVLRRLDTRPRARAERRNRYAMWQSLAQAELFQREPNKFDTAAQLHRHVFGDLKRLAAAGRFRLLMVILPTKYQVEYASCAEDFQEMEALLDLDSTLSWDDRVRRDLRAALDEHAIPYYDAHDDFRRQAGAGGPLLYWNADHHLSEEGHALLGRYLAKSLEPVLRDSGKEDSR
jgi:lysophospholipase L1-like esterase